MGGVKQHVPVSAVEGAYCHLAELKNFSTNVKLLDGFEHNYIIIWILEDVPDTFWNATYHWNDITKITLDENKLHLQ